jgi:DNA (cytosine-5)-methyltransferase 1
VKFELTNFCEIDKHAIESYCRIHHEDKSKNLGDITAIEASSIADCNVIVGGSPCLVGDSIVTTKDGCKQLIDVKPGDMVLSHDGKYHEVVRFMEQGIKNVYAITSPYFDTIYATGNHRFYVRRGNSSPEWLSVEDLISRNDYYMGIFISWHEKPSPDVVCEGIYTWVPFTIEKTDKYEPVYDIEVAESHSFVVNNCITHNCQDFSSAGKKKGAMWTCKDCGHEYNPLEVHYTKRNSCPVCGSHELERTRSSLIVEYLRMIREKKPNFAVYENVKNLIGKEFKTLFDKFLDELHEYGYNTYYSVMNAKHYGIPQNRERVILVIIKKELDNGLFKFPEPFDAGIRLFHVLEGSVPNKYYLAQEKTDKLLKTLSDESVAKISDLDNNGLSNVKEDVENAIETDSDKPITNKLCVACRGRNPEEPNLRVAGVHTEQRLEPNWNGTTNTLTSVQKDNWVLEQEIIVDKSIKPCVRKNFEREKEQIAISDKEIYQCKCDSGWQDNKIGIKVSPTLRANNPFTCVYANCCIRRLTPLECFRLMGFTDEDFYNAQNQNTENYNSKKGDYIMSDTQLYKQAGNSIVTNVLYYTYKNLYDAMPYLFEDIKLLSLFSGIGAFEKAFYMLQEYIENPSYTPIKFYESNSALKPQRVGQVSSENSQAGTVYSDQNVSPTLCAGSHGYAMGYILTENFQKPPTT